ncbi:hypothetical protein AVDCRST_MAG94-775 [uncultured Leptolyngbya sp.]|uniref:Uncharacterized protein n=1 Tax=uncultured Leptolyngbya sp. TaxID=332963 RepID=A0A6J4KK14_9CYAN|nr:hypothetical protein AVDCRST_MAG94-775 [uncultured Leptolyngbya sp.]
MDDRSAYSTYRNCCDQSSKLFLLFISAIELYLNPVIYVGVVWKE